MTSDRPARPSLIRPSLFALTWHVCTWLGLAVVGWSLTSLDFSAYAAMGWSLLMIAAVIAAAELRPIVMTRLAGNPVSISCAFVFAAMYLWGLFPAVLLLTGAVLMSEVMQRKAPWKVAFNIGQDVVCLTAAWLVMRAAGNNPTPLETPALAFDDLWWIPLTWVVYHLLNLALVSGLAEDDGQTWAESFTEEFWFYTTTTLVVLALSPLIAVVAQAHTGSWVFLPLLLVPLLGVQRAAQLWQEQEHRALHDHLTGLPNRVLLADRIQHALARSDRTAGDVVVVFLDIDLFKVVNDSLGHEAGDDLLVQIAGRLSAAVRPGDTLARFGGDEFVFVCEDVARGEAEHLATRITSALSEPFWFGDREVAVTASAGVVLGDSGSDAQTLLRDADAALYRAKERGRHRVVQFDEGIRRHAAHRLDDEVGLRRALQHGELRTFFQPVIDLASDRTAGLEALIRWEDPQRGLLPPAEFLPVAEETGLVVPMGDWILADALDWLRRWEREVPNGDFWVAINLSIRQLQTPGIAERIATCLHNSGVAASRLRVEITESAVMDEVAARSLLALRDLGLAIAVDDFGTGYSSLAYLKQLPVACVKIDGSFVDGLGGPDDASDRPIVDAILKMATALRLEVIAEGVETLQQLGVLRELGGQLAQGYLWARPMPADQVAAWLTSRDQARPAVADLLPAARQP